MNPTLLNILISIFGLSFLLNLIWEVKHSTLYTTTLNMELRKYAPYIIKQSLKNGFFVTILYLATFFVFKNIDITSNLYQLSTFAIISVLFSFIDEKISLKKERWKYDRRMPLFFGVGITPLIEFAITGIITFFIVFKFLV